LDVLALVTTASRDPVSLSELGPFRRFAALLVNGRTSLDVRRPLGLLISRVASASLVM